MLSVSDIRINHIKEPKGIKNAIIVGWKLISHNSGVFQKGYRMQISETEDFTEFVLDTGMTESEESTNIRVSLPEWKSLNQYYLRVKVQDNYDELSDWYTTIFMTALSLEDEWRASFISAEQLKDKNHSPVTGVRKRFYVEKPLKEAFLVSTAQGVYQTFLNGIRVGEDELTPGWTSYHKILLYQTYEVSDMIMPGENVWSALIGAGWYKGDVSYYRIHNFYGDYASFSGELLLRYEDGSEESICTDDTWKGADSEILFSDIYDGEMCDSRLKIPGWGNPGLSDDGWRNVQITGQRTGRITPQCGSTVKVHEILEAKDVLVTPKGETVIDFGQNISGWTAFKVKASKGDVVEYVCFETLDSGGNVYTENLRTAKQTIQYICSGEGIEEYHPQFTFQGFRYAWIKQYPGKVVPENFKALALY